MNTKVTPIEAARGVGIQSLPTIIVGDERALRHLAELLAPYMPAPPAPAESERWLSTREAAEYGGTTTNALHKAMAAREIHFEQDTPGGKAWFQRADVDAWRRGERPGGTVRRAA